MSSWGSRKSSARLFVFPPALRSNRRKIETLETALQDDAIRPEAEEIFAVNDREGNCRTKRKEAGFASSCTATSHGS